ncbi:abortive infection system antitoxin AbiGi family protein [Lysinibacillus xylanilyticus]|uniref:abortive infection system antitoxin AbiGi family protein n=1 Tax=Lysinibacillus xylanilyticus TaxID=582475 RepID=UPI003820FC9A
MVQQMSDVRVINVTEAPNTNEQSSFIRPKQSANVLFKFMNRLDYLKDIIKNEAIMPRYYEEMIDYLNIEGIDKIAFPMSCFCDIHLNKLVYHMENYGYYGLGLSKVWGIKQGIQPIHYINTYSELRNDFSDIFNDIFKMSNEERTKHKVYHDYLLHKLFFMKPIEGKMITSDGYPHRNFHDEKEWRFIPSFKNVETDLPMVVDQEQLNPKSYNAYSQGISQKTELWLKFEFEAIKYIIVNNQDDRKELIEFIIDHQIGESEYERHTLISKIMVFTELGEDW